MPKLAPIVVDLAGLAKLVERRGKSFAIMELVQNAWDEAVTTVTVTLVAYGRGTALLVVEDDSPEGFRDLSHAYTMFADSYKKSDPLKRGRFNLGEKLVVALAHTFTVETTTGSVIIDVKAGTREMKPAVRAYGTKVTAVLRMTKREIEEASAAIQTVLPPPGVQTIFNGHTISARAPQRSFTVTLATEIADAEGYLRPTRRQCCVEIIEPWPNEKAMLYEMGIPVVETGDRWHVNVLQKVPLNSDRDNVTPAYLRDVRTHVLNEMATNLTGEEASANWVNEALEDEAVEPEAVEKVLTKRFGEKRVSFDPSDPEANRIAMAAGYTVVPGRSLSRDAWKNVKRVEALKPAGQVTPSPKPYDADGVPMETIPPENWTDGMRDMATFAANVGNTILGTRGLVKVVFKNNSRVFWAAVFGPDYALEFNVGRLGYAWFDRPHDDVAVLDLLIHEFAHFDGASHMSEQYDKNLSLIGARMTALALSEPEMFEAPDTFGL